MEERLISTLRDLIAEKMNFTVIDFLCVAVGGGSINDAYRLQVNKTKDFFCKVNSATKFPGLFESEKAGLELLRTNGSTRIPNLYGVSYFEDKQVLLMEWIKPGTKTGAFWEEFGRQLASLHSQTAEHFGLGANNYMGALPQENSLQADWIEFFINNRLQPQIKLALHRGRPQRSDLSYFENLFKRLGSIFPANKPALVHGDLWSGNFLCDDNSNPVLIDPAVYYGIPQVDLGMTTLFGGFENPFYAAYQQVLPFDPNYEEQWDVCNLYPLLIHLNLFGTSYYSSVASIIERF